jgi:hypothetical protein
MYDYIDELIKETQLMKGTSTTPAVSHLLAVNPDCDKLNVANVVLHHHLTAKLLCLSKRTQPDQQLAVSVLTKCIVKMIGKS